MLFGAILALATYWATPVLIGYWQDFLLAAPGGRMSNFFADALFWVEANVWVHWVGTIGIGAAILIGAFLINDAVLPVDFGEYVQGCFYAAVLGFVLSMIGVAIFALTFETSVLALAAGAGVGLSSLVIAFFAVLD